MPLNRRNDRLYLWVRATMLTVIVYGALASTGLSPSWVPPLLALIAGGVSLLSADLGVIATVVALAVPLLAVDAVLGSLLIGVALASLRYLGSDGARPFMALATGVAAALIGPAWLGPLIAGFILGAGEGAIIAAVSCVVVQATGLLLGLSTVPSPAGVTLIGGDTPAALSFAALPGIDITKLSWLAESFGAAGSDNVSRIFGSFTGASQPVALMLQPLAWAAVAGVVGAVAEVGRSRNNIALIYASIPLGALVGAIGTVLTYAVVAVDVPWWPQVGVALISSAGLGLLLALGYEQLFRAQPPEAIERVGAARRARTIAAEDADVDELLRLIATAEERLATDHTTDKVVMITDMKSFSRMTEEDGSMLTAKAIQRHRDLLLPIIESHNGHGKSTGGDGLVAAFDSAQDAVAAAAEMQATLDASNAMHASERPLSIRVGVANGEVVLDRSGRPFIGTGLNLAARVMNLADGGQVFVSDSVAVDAPMARTYSHGTYELKNIAHPVEIFEVLWADDQEPVAPGGAEES